MRKLPSALLVVFALIALPAARAAVTTSGDFQTGSPVPTLNVTTAFTLHIAATDSLQALVFDEWVTSDGTQTNASASPTNQTLSYQINSGPLLTIGISRLSDNLGSNFGGITANDGILIFATDISVTAGQTVTFLPGSLTFASGGDDFNPPPATFTGNAFAGGTSGARISDDASVSAAPEPSTLTMLAAGLGLLGSLTLRRRTSAAR